MNDDPLLIVEGAPEESGHLGLMIGMVGAMTSVGYAVTLLKSMPGVGWGDPAFKLTLGAGLGAALVALLGGTAWTIRARRRLGKIAFFADRIVLRKGRRKREVSWRELRGYTDHSSDVVALHARNRRKFFIPTLDEEVRTQVLALLSERGLERLGS